MSDRIRLPTNESISTQQMAEAIKRSGYLLEQRAATQLREAKYKVVTNRRFIDQETYKSREYDVYAYKEIALYKTDSHSIFPTLVCECKNIAQPIAFLIDEPFSFEPLIDEVMVSGMPAKIYKNGKYISLQEYVNIKSFHHYCKPVAPVATQCCTFTKKKDESTWAANYSEILYETYRTLVKALEYEIEEDFKNMSQWLSVDEIEKEFMDLSFYYPVMIFQGDIYTYTENSSDPLKPCMHVQYNPEFISFHSNSLISYHIDVIAEQYLPDYLKIINQEMNTLKEKLRQQKNELGLSVSKIIKECTGLKQRPNTYRPYLEFDSDM